MTFEVIIRREAQIDLDEIFVWYEEQKPGLGFAFIEEFEVTLNKIIRNPFYASYLYNEARSTSLKKIPYPVIYKVDEANRQIRVVAVIHHRRNPGWFRQRPGN